MNKTRYVLMVVADPSTGHVVGLTKKKGPEFLVGRFTFPGGRMEVCESAAAAATREMREETGVHVPVDDWRLVEHRVTPTSELCVLAATSNQVLQARTLEEEPVWQLAYERHMDYAREQPSRYAPDFVQVLSAALRMLGLRREAFAPVF